MQSDFVARTEPHRRELLAHCYRMLGSLDEAEDAVQETYLRAWRGYRGFEARSSVRVWLYRIATNACLTALAGRRPPSSLDSHPDWLGPVPDALVTPASEDPAAIAATRDSLRLALIASLQYLPPRQRAVLILRDVLAWSAAEVAATLETSTAAVKSMLARARARLDQVTPGAGRFAEPSEPAQRALLDRYMKAFEEADAAELERLLRADATLEVVPAGGRFDGKVRCLEAIRKEITEPGLWRMVPTRANGQPAALAYRRSGAGEYRPFGVAVLTVSETHLTSIVLFPRPDLVDRFRLP